MREKSKMRQAILAAALCLSFSVAARAQGPERPERKASQRQAANDAALRLPDQGDLARENLKRVAASAAQIKSILVKDPGLLVELKGWVAKEAADYGQIVDDNALSDQAIWDRLDQDIVFRSIATRLLQKYGYLLPTINPESDLGKEQDLVLKERARRMVQVEAQEDAQALQPPGKTQETRQSDVEECDPTVRRDCGLARQYRRRQQGPPNFDSPQFDGGSDQGFPGGSIPFRNPQILTTRLGGDSDEYSPFDLGGGGGVGGGDTGNLAALAKQLGAGGGGASVGGSGLDQAASALAQRQLGGSGEAALLGAGMSGGSSSDMMSGRPLSRVIPRGANGYGPSAADYREQPEKELSPVTITHKRNPYADVPSLYDLYVQASPRQREPERFGLEFFRNGTQDLDQIPMDLPAGPDYVVGPGDGLSINLWGGVSRRLVRQVDREGRINLPEVGPVLVSGRSLGDVQNSVQQAVSSQFRDTSVDVSLSRIRTVRVYVVGEVIEPGAYDVSSLSTPLNALFEAGGITPRGSLRNVKHYRGKQLVEEVDAYDLLLRGVNSGGKLIENGDSLVVPPVGEQVTVTGMVRRPAVYELNGETSLEDVLELAGGILPAAALKHVEVQRLEAHEKRTMLDLPIPTDSDAAIAAQLQAFKIKDGDQIHIFPIAPYNEQAVYLQGHVLRPGQYSYKEGMSLTDIVSSYSDLLPEPSGQYAEIIRLNPPDFRPSVESFNLTAALSKPETAPKLKPLDTVRIFSKYDFEAAPTVFVSGDVRQPGQYRTSGQASVRDAVFLAGGTTPDADLRTAQIFRTEADGKLRIFSVNLGKALAGDPEENLRLLPRDRILVHANLLKVDPASVTIKGEVARPGKYPFTSNMHVEDLINAAGGLKRSADTQIADLTRYAEGDKPATPSESFTVSLKGAAEGEEKDNPALRPGDVLSIRQSPGWNDIGAEMQVKGEVLYPGTFGIQPGERLSSVLERAGGFGPQAFPYGAVLTRKEVREFELTSYTELVERVKQEQVQLKALPAADEDQKNAKLTAVAQADTTLQQLTANPPIGRVVIHIQPEINKWKNTQWDIPVRAGDVLIVPKKPNVVMVMGQVFNPTAISYRPGHSAKWYLSQAGGYTQIADKNAAFVVRADGSVLAAKNNGGLFSGDPMNTALKPGDSIVVPEKALRVGTRNWQNVFQAAQVASSVALAIAYIHP